MLSSVKVNREQLLSTVKENRSKHAHIVAEAKEGYVIKAQEVFQEKLEKAKNGVVDTDLRLQEPQDYTKEYDTAIAMLDWETEPTIELSQNDFKAFVMDDWSWKHSFLLSNANYSHIASGLAYGESL